MICNLNIEKAFYDNNLVLEDINFSLNKGDILAIVGESGSGKTTLARIISGLYRFYPLTFKGEIQTNEEVDIVPQNITDSLDPLFTIRQQFEEICKDERKIKKTLKEVGFNDIKGILKSYPHNLSGGQRQRILIAQALLRARFIIADEFTSALDSITKLKVIELLKKLNKKEGITLIFITHDMELLNFNGKLVVLYSGNIVEMGNLSEVKSNPIHPYTRFLLSSTPKADMHYTKERFREIKTDINSACRFVKSCPKSSQICKDKKPPLKQKDGRWIRCHF